MIEFIFYIVYNADNLFDETRGKPGDYDTYGI